MPLDHFLPATYIAGFSLDPNPIRRNRQIWVGDKRTGRVFQAPVSRICAINDFYTLEEPGVHSARIVDQTWSFYEARLATAIEHFSCGDLTSIADLFGGFLAGIPIWRSIRNFSDR